MWIIWLSLVGFTPGFLQETETEQTAVLGSTVRPRQFGHNGLLVVDDENSLWLLTRYCKKLLAAGWVAVHAPI